MVVATSVVPATPTPAFDTAAVRELLMAAFSDEEFMTFCYDYFRPAHAAFSIEMSRWRKTQILVEHCERRGRMEELLAKIERDNPYQYGQLKNRLRMVEPPPGPKPGPEPSSDTYAGATTVKAPTPEKMEKIEPPVEKPVSEGGPIIDGLTGRRKFSLKFPIIRLPKDYRWKPRLWQTIIWLVVAGVLLFLLGAVNMNLPMGDALTISYLGIVFLEVLIFFRLVWIWWPHKKQL